MFNPNNDFIKYVSYFILGLIGSSVYMLETPKKENKWQGMLGGLVGGLMAALSSGFILEFIFYEYANHPIFMENYAFQLSGLISFFIGLSFTRLSKIILKKIISAAEYNLDIIKPKDEEENNDKSNKSE